MSDPIKKELTEKQAKARLNNGNETARKEAAKEVNTTAIALSIPAFIAIVTLLFG